jgi:hypothetical protein
MPTVRLPVVMDALAAPLLSYFPFSFEPKSAFANSEAAFTKDFALSAIPRIFSR